MRRWAAMALIVAVTPLASFASSVTERGWTARFEAPTNRYGHGIMGDLPEWGRLCLTHKDGRGGCLTLPDERVFEDMAPRLADVDGDGLPEAVVVETEVSSGAALVIYRLNGDRFQRIATPYIGRSFRWLAPAGIADLNGDGAMDFAYVDRPHLAKTLRVWSYRDGKLEEIASARGLTNHRIGEEFISGGVRDCGAGPEIITADANWQQVIATRLEGSKLESRTIGTFDGQRSLAGALACKG